jgi:hypothetical protein
MAGVISLRLGLIFAVRGTCNEIGCIGHHLEGI